MTPELAQTLAGPPAPRRSRCGYGVVRAQLDAETLEAVDRAVMGPAWPDRVVAALLAGAGHAVGQQMLGRHRRGECSCPTTDKAAE